MLLARKPSIFFSKAFVSPPLVEGHLQGRWRWGWFKAALVVLQHGTGVLLLLPPHSSPGRRGEGTRLLVQGIVLSSCFLGSCHLSVLPTLWTLGILVGKGVRPRIWDTTSHESLGSLREWTALPRRPDDHWNRVLGPLSPLSLVGSARMGCSWGGLEIP